MTNPLGSLGRRHYVSLSGLESILKDLKRDHDLDIQGTSRRTLKRARDVEVDIETPHGQVLTEMTIQLLTKSSRTELQEKALPVLNLGAFLWHACQSLPQFAAFFQRRLGQHASTAESPWQICLYADEITPGNPLKASNTRKVWAFYLSFAEFGAEARCQEDMWFCVCLARTSVVQKMRGGLSELTNLLAQSLHRQLATGCLLTISGERVMFFATVQTMVADEAALKAAFAVKGASGIAPCALCSNVVSRRSGLDEHDVTGELAAIHETDVLRFRARSDDDLWSAHAALQARHGSIAAAAFEQMEKSLGVNFNPHGVLAARSLPLVSTWMFDWLHIYCVTGLFNLELGLLLPVIYAAGYSHTALHQFMAALRWPQHLTTRRQEALRHFEKKHEPGEYFKGEASACLSAYSMLRIFLLSLDRATWGEELDKAARSFLKLCTVLDLLLAGNRGQDVNAQQLQGKIVAHCRAFLVAYGRDRVIPKFHYALHLGLIAETKQLISCFTHERKHRHIKQIANNMHNPQDWFERSVFKDVWGRVLLTLEEASETLQPHLVSPAAAPALLQFQLAAAFGPEAAINAGVSLNAVVAPGQSCQRGDIVLCNNGRVAELWLHTRLSDGRLMSLLSFLESRGGNKFKCTGNAEFVESALISRACIFSRDGDVLTALP